MLFDKDNEALARTLHTALQEGRRIMLPFMVDWKLNYHYLQGRREFAINGWLTGDIEAGYATNPGGKLPFRWEDIVEQYNRELGQMLQVDISPMVTPRKAWELDGVRKAAAAQAYLDHLTSNLMLDELKKELFECCLMYGMTGVGAWCNIDTSLALDTQLEIIPPWHLIPLPARARRSGEVRGVGRVRLVPYAEFREQHPELKFPAKDDPNNAPDASLEIQWIRVGDSPEEDRQSLTLPGMTSETGAPTYKAHEGEEPHVRVSEIWVPDHRGRIKNYIVMVGRHIAKRVENKTPAPNILMPIGIARSQHTNNFYARPWLSMLLSMNNEVEKCLGRLFQNMQDLDTLPLMAIPADHGITEDMLKSTSRPRAFFTTPDFTGNPFKIETVEPVNMHDIPGRVAKFGTELSDRLGRNSPLFQGRSLGRLDSASGLSFVMETSNVPRNPFFTSVESAMAVIYRCLLGRGATLPHTPFELMTVDDSLAGIALDKDGKVALGPNSLPSPEEVKISVKEREPRSVTQRKQEVWTSYQQKIIDLTDLVWINHQEQLGLPVGHDEIVEQIQLGMLRNIELFNDGERPGSVVFDPVADDIELQIRVLSRFIRTVRFSLASPEVKQAFKDTLGQYKEALGSFPEQLPYPEDAGESGLPPQLERMIGGAPPTQAPTGV